MNTMSNVIIKNTSKRTIIVSQIDSNKKERLTYIKQQWTLMPGEEFVWEPEKSIYIWSELFMEKKK